jgi:hypothetical protein
MLWKSGTLRAEALRSLEVESDPFVRKLVVALRSD